MQLNKLQGYFFFIFVLIAIMLLYQAIWLVSGTTTGEIVEFGKGTGKTYKHIENVTIRYSVQNEEYVETFLRNGINSEPIEIRYLLFAPSFSRINNFLGNWGVVLCIFLIGLLAVSVSFLIQDIVPNGSLFLLSPVFPFVKIKKPEKPLDPDDQYAW